MAASLKDLNANLEEDLDEAIRDVRSRISTLPGGPSVVARTA